MPRNAGHLRGTEKCLRPDVDAGEPKRLCRLPIFLLLSLTFFLDMRHHSQIFCNFEAEYSPKYVFIMATPIRPIPVEGVLSPCNPKTRYMYFDLIDVVRK